MRSLSLLPRLLPILADYESSIRGTYSRDRLELAASKWDRESGEPICSLSFEVDVISADSAVGTVSRSDGTSVTARFQIRGHAGNLVDRWVGVWQILDAGRTCEGYVEVRSDQRGRFEAPGCGLAGQVRTAWISGMSFVWFLEPVLWSACPSVPSLVSMGTGTFFGESLYVEAMRAPDDPCDRVLFSGRRVQ